MKKKKNCWVIPTNKPSRLIFDKEENRLLPLQDDTVFMEYQNLVENQNIYITSDEEIKEGDWSINLNSPYAHKEVCRIDNQIELERYAQKTGNNCKKIILTTDDQLIADGVQAIDDEFLEWFVKNPSCEEVEVDKNWNYPLDKSWKYKVTIPSEEPKKCKCGCNWVNTTNKDNPFCFHCGKPLTQEPKQETQQEESKEFKRGYDLAEKAIQEGNCPEELLNQSIISLTFDDFDKGWETACKKAIIPKEEPKQERMYSEEDLIGNQENSIDTFLLNSKSYSQEEREVIMSAISEWVEQFKKK